MRVGGTRIASGRRPRCVTGRACLNELEMWLAVLFRARTKIDRTRHYGGAQGLNNACESLTWRTFERLRGELAEWP